MKIGVQSQNLVDEYGKEKALSKCTFTAPKGYSFAGWYATPDFSGNKVKTVNAETTGTLYAKWIPHLQYDAEYGVERIYTTDDIVTAKYNADNGEVYWQVEAIDGSDLCILNFRIEEPDAELVIPEGEYAINDSWDYGIDWFRY